MFKFNFNVDEKHDNERSLEISDDVKAGDPGKCRKHAIVPDIQISSEMLTFQASTHGPEIKFVKSSDVIDQMIDKPAFLNANSDLVKNVYEGGMKIWECSHDLVRHLSKSQELLQGKNVLEIGCGAALPGLFCMLSKANSVVLQDYNAEVIEHITMPNCSLNSHSNAVELYSGDWADFLAKMANRKFDLILTSETIYDEANYPKLLAIFDQLLDPQGEILLAAKTHYFGVGGGIQNFQEAMDKTCKWNHVSVYENCDTVKREILHIKRKMQH